MPSATILRYSIAHSLSSVSRSPTWINVSGKGMEYTALTGDTRGFESSEMLPPTYARADTFQVTCSSEHPQRRSAKSKTQSMGHYKRHAAVLSSFHQITYSTQSLKEWASL